MGVWCEEYKILRVEREKVFTIHYVGKKDLYSCCYVLDLNQGHVIKKNSILHNTR